MENAISLVLVEDIVCCFGLSPLLAELKRMLSHKHTPRIEVLFWCFFKVPEIDIKTHV